MSEEDLANNKTYISDFDITKHIVLDNESNYWYSAEYVDKMLKKQDKEIERLKEDNEYLNKVNIELSTEKNRLNNIINKAIEILDIYGTSKYETADLLYSTLRGSDKE